jgi:hypothetical protein
MEAKLIGMEERGASATKTLERIDQYLNLKVLTTPNNPSKLPKLVIARRTQWIQNIPQVNASKRFETLRNTF